MGWFCFPGGRLTVSGEIFHCQKWGLFYWLKPPVMHRTAPHNKNYLFHNVKSAEGEKS